MSVLNLIRTDILNSQNYSPGGTEAQYRLHANELPWAPVTADFAGLNFYPDNTLELQLQDQLAKRYRVEKDQIVLTRGSDDGIDLVTRLFLEAGKDALLQFPPTFPMYAFYVRLQQAELIQCPLNHLDNFSLTPDRIRRFWQPNCKIILFCSPNNPTANLMDKDLIAATCEHYRNRSLIVVDEAYIEFASSQSVVNLIPQFDNLVVLRTLSKANGLAGLRLGSILAQSQLIAAFRKIIAPYPLSSPVLNIAKSALTKIDWLTLSVQRIHKERAWLVDQMKRFPVIEKIYPSEANFILIKSAYASELSVWFSGQGIAVRDFPTASLLEHHLRITVGDELQNHYLILTLAAFSAKTPVMDKRQSKSM